eukprot:scaffold26569_cov107-Isochrysis_galbana.AAC.7
MVPAASPTFSSRVSYADSFHEGWNPSDTLSGSEPFQFPEPSGARRLLTGDAISHVHARGLRLLSSTAMMVP